MKALICIIIFLASIAVGVNVSRWAKAKGTFNSPFNLGMFAAGVVLAIAIVAIKVLARLGWWPE